MKAFEKQVSTIAVAFFISLTASSNNAVATSHMDAPLITLDDAVNTTDVYAFKTQRDGVDYLTTALAVYPFEEPGIGPNKYNFDDTARYNIHVSLGKDVARGRATYSYHFNFDTKFKNKNTILQSYLGVIDNVGDAGQNLTQSYSVTRVNNRTGQRVRLGTGRVPPNNQGIATPKYNRDNDGNQPARDGVAYRGDLDTYTSQGVYRLKGNHVAFAGQRDDGFYADVLAVFDLLQLRAQGEDSQGGFNVHTIVLNIPIESLGGPDQVVGVYASTDRRASHIRSGRKAGHHGRWVQVARQGNPLFNEGFVALADKDRYSRTSPASDAKLFRRYAAQPELAKLLNQLVIPGSGLDPAVESDRTDLVGIFIPDVIKIDLSTAPARLAGGGSDHASNPDDAGFSRLSVFGGDVLTSRVQAGLPGFPAGTIPGGWPNGRRFGDDVLDIGVSAIISDLRSDPLIIQVAGDNVDANDIAYNKVFPYAATPLNGRVHSHP